MAAPVKPDQSGQPGSRVIPRAGESSSQTTQPTNPPQPQATEAAPRAGESVTPPSAPSGPTREQQLIAAQEAVLREQSQELARLRQSQRAVEGRIQNIENPPPSREEENNRFWKDPVGVINDLVQKELKKTVEPINQYIGSQRTETQYDRAKAKLKVEFGDVWDHIESEVDRFVDAASAAGNEINDQLLNVAALAATGAYHRGLLGGNGAATTPATPPAPPAPTPPAPRLDMSTPAHLRPSAPVIPGHERPQAEQRRELSENEARLARERGMTKEQFLDWIEVPAASVVHSRIGRPAQ